MSVTLYSKARPRLTHDADVASSPTVQLEASGDDYEQAQSRLVDQVPEGWVLLGISTW